MIESLRITTLVDNHALLGSSFHAEHGLSFLIEADGEKILFDTGQSAEIIAHNLDILNIDLADLKYMVLSHGHYDHTGGLEEVAKRTRFATLFAHPDAFDKKFANKGELIKSIGIPFGEKMLKDRFRFHLTKSPCEVTDSAKTTGQIPRITNFEQIPGMYLVIDETGYLKDEILDDQALILETKKGIIVFLGCTHSGLVNTLSYVEKMTGKKEIWGVMGGMHLRAAKKSRLNQTARILKKYRIQIIGLSHCSGENAFLHFSSQFGNKVFLNCTGNVIEIK